jgi:hypothetical protein
VSRGYESLRLGLPGIVGVAAETLHGGRPYILRVGAILYIALSMQMS